MARIGSKKLRLTMSMLLALGLMVLLPAAASAHPEDCLPHDDGEGPNDEPHTEEICLSEEEIAAMDDSEAVLPANALVSENMALRANLPKTGAFAGASAFNSDLAFWGDYAYMGNYEGYEIYDISNPGRPRLVNQVVCPGSQNDVSVYEGSNGQRLLFTSTDSSRNTYECENNVPQSATIKESWEGIRIHDVTDPQNPYLLTAVETDCGSHTHTLVPQRDRIHIYVSSYSPNATFPDCQPPHDKISIVEVPLNDPASAKVVAEPVLFPDGGLRPITSGCHDITVFQAYNLAAGACMGEGVMMDIRNPVNPQVLSRFTDDNFAFWHSAVFSNDARTVVFHDELGGGGGPTCNPTVGPNRGADAFYDMRNPRNPRLLSYFKIPRTQSNTENCVAHNANVVPLPGGRDVMVQAWYQGGTTMVDFTDPRNPREIGWIDRGPISDTQLVLGGHWSSYWYNGNIFGSEIQRGFDVMVPLGPAADAVSRARRLPYLNAQTQELVPRF